MAAGSRTIVRAFDGSLADAQRLLAVEQATFDESPYSADQVRSMLTDGSQRAWLALVEGEAAGFVIAFPTCGLHGPCWEIDLLAVLAAWRGRGLATRLIRAASAYGAEYARRARGVVAVHNHASAGAFAQVGFRQEPGTRHLLIYRPEGCSASPWTGPAVQIQETSDVAAAADWLVPAPDGCDHPGLTLLLAEQQTRPAGYAELLEVQTLLYRGLWIESLVASTRPVRDALVHQAVTRVITGGLDEIGAMVPEADWPVCESLLARGFRSLGEFRWLTARLPLPGRASPPVDTSPSPSTVLIG